MVSTAVVNRRGSRRWTGGHPWIYRSDTVEEPDPPAPGVVAVTDRNGAFLGRALYSPTSEIRLRRLTTRDELIDRRWWAERIRGAADRRRDIQATAYRVVHAEGDGLPSLVVDRYGPYLVAQLLSAGIEACRDDVLGGLQDELDPEGLLLRNDAPVRRYEDLALAVEPVAGDVPRQVEVEAGGVRYTVEPWTGQKTGAFLDQRENHELAGSIARGRVLDMFTYEGGFALHVAGRADRVVAVDQSTEALARAAANAELNGRTNIEWTPGNAFDVLRALDDGNERFDIIVLDPPAFAKSKDRLERAVRGYKEINLRAMRILAPGGRLLTFSCSFHVGRPVFANMIVDAARDSGRRVVLERLLNQSSDHPELVTVPETGYLKGALLRIDD